MTYDVEPTLRFVKELLEQLEPKRFVQVRIGSPPKAVLPEGFNAVISLAEERPTGETTLETTIDLHVLRVGIYRAQAAAADEAVELLRARIANEVLDALKGDYTLGGTVRNVSFGQYGQVPTVEYDEEEIAGKPYWTTRLLVPLIVDSDVVMAA